MKLVEDLGTMYPNANSKQRKRYGIYKCPSCLNERKYESYRMKDRTNHVCVSCFTIDKNKKHGHSRTRLYRIHSGIKQRCLNEKNPAYKHYGERGILICKEWLVSFESFRKWSLENGYSDNLTIDRINTNGNYEPENCRWADKSTQSQNTRIRKDNTSGYRGVSWHSRDEKWWVQLNSKNKTIRLGYFENDIEAAKAYDSYIIENNLEHTRNFMSLS